MGRDYRRILRERGEPDPPLGRPRLGSPEVRVRKLWLTLSEAEQAAFMCWAGLVPAPTEERPLDPS